MKAHVRMAMHVINVVMKARLRVEEVGRHHSKVIPLQLAHNLQNGGKQYRTLRHTL